VAGECPLKDASNAKWLWASDFNSEEPGVEAADSDFSRVDRSGVTVPAGLAKIFEEILEEVEEGVVRDDDDDDENAPKDTSAVRVDESPVLVEVASGEIEDN
jgi:hypothetical protein